MKTSLYIVVLYSHKQNDTAKCIVSANNEAEAIDKARNDWGRADDRMQYCEFLVACTLAESDCGSISKRL